MTKKKKRRKEYVHVENGLPSPSEPESPSRSTWISSCKVCVLLPVVDLFFCFIVYVRCIGQMMKMISCFHVVDWSWRWRSVRTSALRWTGMLLLSDSELHCICIVAVALSFHRVMNVESWWGTKDFVICVIDEERWVDVSMTEVKWRWLLSSFGLLRCYWRWKMKSKDDGKFVFSIKKC